MNFIMNQEAIE